MSGDIPDRFTWITSKFKLTGPDSIIQNFSLISICNFVGQGRFQGIQTPAGLCRLLQACQITGNIGIIGDYDSGMSFLSDNTAMHSGLGEPDVHSFSISSVLSIEFAGQR